MRRRAVLRRSGLITCGALLTFTLMGCGEQPPGDGEPVPATVTSAVPSQPSTPTPTTASTPSDEPSTPSIDLSHPLVIPESDPALWPPGLFADRTPAERDAAIADWGDRTTCSPFSLIIDYDAGLISPEEYTAYALYSFERGMGRVLVPLGLELPERYLVCDDASLEPLGFTMGLYLDYIDPAFRNELWLRTQGVTYDEAHRPLTDEEVDQAFEEFYGDELPEQ